MNAFAQKIIFIRTSLNLTQDEFAKRIGYSRSYLSDIEGGRVEPSRRFLEAISDNFKISIDSILLGVRIINAMSRIEKYSDTGFLYLYDFTDRGLEEIKSELLRTLESEPYIFLDGSTLKRGQDFNLIKDELIKNNIKYLILKDFSATKIKENKAAILRILINMTSKLCTLILIGKPSFLEKYAGRLHYYAYPLWFGDRGRMHF